MGSKASRVLARYGPGELSFSVALAFAMNLWANKKLSQQGRSDRDPQWDSRDATWSKQRPTRRPSVGVQDKKEFAA
ncbi:predicted protein [Chaetomium globosum CBS 148.51]|uniref:Uncharacterized protein n=1 Tax=Chaetomium globosum (strain ATCC 6205 / CBS 148.51 / DSM 1962 / NBRC 6347 / NRRL 1970) TaxID=306901 RepID=Q2HAZ0_CHAGB|nr:uncharacterized protein CHGG_02614 [Chaetomium globosum CBS 148.51]EAQ90679.1 predicted protein [Chaetomium globosum CBS 148.51]